MFFTIVANLFYIFPSILQKVYITPVSFFQLPNILVNIRLLYLLIAKLTIYYLQIMSLNTIPIKKARPGFNSQPGS